MQFIIEFQADHLFKVLAAVHKEVAFPHQMLDVVGFELERVNRERHDQGLDPDGKPWKPLAASTLAAGKRKGGPLKKSGDMLHSFNHQVQGDTLRLGFDDSRVGGKLPSIHHFGTKPYTITARKKKGMSVGGGKRINHPGIPSRELVGFPFSDQNLVTDVLDDHLKAVLNSVR
jgi:phage gpG-like protein